MASGLFSAGPTFPVRTPSDPEDWSIHSGHSLTDTYMAGPAPGRLIQAVRTIAGVSDPFNRIDKSTIPGSSMLYRWENPTDAGDYDATNEIGNHKLLVITESVPMRDAPTFQTHTLDVFEDFVAQTWANGDGGAGAETMLYSIWYEIDDPDEAAWRTRLDEEGVKWEAIQDWGNSTRPSGCPFIYMVPGHRLMMRLYDDIQASNTPTGIDSISDIMADGIHPSAPGQYMVACLMYACLYHRDPDELPDRLETPEDNVITSDQSAYFKLIAKEVAEGYPFKTPSALVHETTSLRSFKSVSKERTEPTTRPWFGANFSE